MDVGKALLYVHGKYFLRELYFCLPSISINGVYSVKKYTAYSSVTDLGPDAQSYS